MILAAGRGKRMGILTNDLPKPLLAVNGKPLIQYHLEALKKSGVTHFVINLGYQGHYIERYLDNGKALGINIEYTYEDPILDTGGGVANALPLLGTNPFIVVSADIYTDFPFSTLPKVLKGLLHLVMVDNPYHHPKGDFGLEADRLVKRNENLLNFAGIGMYRPELFEGCRKGPFPLIHLYDQAIEHSEAYGQYYQGLWHNIGTPEQLEMIQTGNK